MKNLIFLGYPGSGKGTISKLFEASHKQISPGDLLRKEIKTGSALGQQIASIIDRGNFVSDQMSFALVKQNITENHHYIFDGFPRTLKQAEDLDSLIRDNYVVINFLIDRVKLVERLIYRYSCPNCGLIFNLRTNPSKELFICDNCKHSLSRRNDDNIEVVQTRFDNHEKMVLPIISYYKEKATQGYGSYFEIDSNRSPELIYEEIKNILKTNN